MTPQQSNFRKRQSAVQEAMAKSGLSSMVVYGNSAYSGSGSAGQGYIRYLAGWTARFGASVLILPKEGLPTLIVPSAHDVLYVKEAFHWVGRCMAETPRNYGNLARRILEKMQPERVGIAGLADMPHQTYVDLTGEAGGWAFTPAEEMLDGFRLLKEPVEVELHREAARISDQMLVILRERLQSFRGPAWQLVADMEHKGRSMGAEIATCWLVAGQPADRPRYRLEENERDIADGDQVLVGTYVTYRGYWAHCLRMGSVGSPSDDYRRIHEAALQQHIAAAAQARAGNDARRIQEEAIKRAEELVPGSTGGAFPARFRQAHFVGLDYAEKPSGLPFPQPDCWTQSSVPQAREVVLQPGMLLEIHTNLGLEGTGFGVMGDIYLVGSDGAERLTTFPQELFQA